MTPRPCIAKIYSARPDRGQLLIEAKFPSAKVARDHARAYEKMHGLKKFACWVELIPTAN